MTEHRKSAYDMLMEFPKELSLYHKEGKAYAERQEARVILGTDDIDISCDDDADFETRGVLFEIAPQAAARLAEICKVRGLEFMEARENKTRLPLDLKARQVSDFGIRATLLTMQDGDIVTEFFIDAGKAEELREGDDFSLDGFHLELSYDGVLSISAEEPYGVYITASLNAAMLEQIAAWQPEERAGMSPA